MIIITMETMFVTVKFNIRQKRLKNLVLLDS